jgi:ABC-type uncharacterized transport system
MNDNKVRFWAWVLCGVITTAIVVVINWLLVPVTAQYDLTQDGRYTIPPALKRIAEKLKSPDPKQADAQREPLKVTVYLSDSLPRYLEHLPRTISTRLNEVRRASDNLVEYEFIDPKDDTDLMTELQDKFKIAPMQLQDFRGGEVTQGAYYLAMVFRYKKEVEPMHLRDVGAELVKEERTLAVLPGLIATRMLKVMTPPEEVVVGIVSDKKMPPQQAAQQGAKPSDGIDPLRERLKAHVHVKDVALKGAGPIASDIKTLLLYKPEGLAPADVFQLDQFMMRGGRVIILLDTYSTFDFDRVTAIDQALQQSKFSLRPVDPGLKDWLAFYGMDILPGVVMDRFNHKLIRNEPVPGTPIPRQEVADMAGLLNVRDLDTNKKPTGQLDQGEMTLAGIGALAFLLPTPMQVDQDEFARNNPGAALSVLARSSPESWVVKDVGDTVPMFRATPPPREEWGSHVLVARATGPLRSYWADKEIPARPNAPPNESRQSDASKLTMAKDQPAQLWVVADADFAHEVWAKAFGRNPLDRYAIAAAQGMGVSSSMVLNIVDVAALGSELVEIRRQRLIDRSIDEEKVKEASSRIRFFNIGLMPLVFVGFGLLWWVFRSLQTFVPSPRQPVTVPAPRSAGTPDLQEASVADKTDSHHP